MESSIGPREGEGMGLRAARGLLAALIALSALSMVLLCQAEPAQAQASAAQRLADKYAPIVKLRKQTDGICDSSEEQFSPPTSVYSVLGNRKVRLLKTVGRRTIVLVKRAPTAADVANRQEGVYLDLPGQPLDPGCRYARDYAALKRSGHAPAVTYAHIARETGEPGFALQYWFFYYFNHFNDLHEGDWEGMQLTFKQDTPEEALSSQPEEIVLFQHSGGERADWDEHKVEKEGNHPVVYSAAGSHGTFYSPGLWLGNGQNGSGVGCDDTTTPLIAVKPRAVLLPDQEENRGPFAWLSYSGRWGQREAGFNNGPAGPNTKVVWREPFTWMAKARTDSPEVPGGSLMGPSIASGFCSVVAQVTSFLNFHSKNKAPAYGILAGLALLIIVPLLITKWGPVQPDVLHQRRAFGQLVLTSLRVYARHLWPFVLIVLSILGLLAALDGIEYLLGAELKLNGPALTFGDPSGLAVKVSTPAGLPRVLVTPIAQAAVAALICNLDRHDDARFLSAWRAVLARFWRLLFVQWLVGLLVLVLMFSVIGIPYGIKKFIDWQFVQQEVLFEDKSIREAMRSSTELVRGHWWHTGIYSAILWLISQIPGPVVGFALLFTSIPVVDVNLVGSVIFALLMPFIETARTLLYFDLGVRDEEAPSPAIAGVAPAPAA
jgi:hypothetical protein